MKIASPESKPPPSIKMLLIGPIGAGKSHFGKASTEHQAPFEIGDGIEAGTIEPITFTYELPPIWASKLSSERKQRNPSEFVWHLIDTPGIDDSNGNDVDEQHLVKIIDFWRNNQIPLNLIVFVMPILPLRFNHALQKTLKIFDAFFNHSHLSIWNSKSSTRCFHNRDNHEKSQM
jgi:hypothetical protein